MQQTTATELNRSYDILSKTLCVVGPGSIGYPPASAFSEHQDDQV